MLDASRFKLGFACCTCMICATHAQLSVFYRLFNSKRFILICSVLDFYRFLSFRCIQLFGCKRATKGQTDVQRERGRDRYTDRPTNISSFMFFLYFFLTVYETFLFCLFNLSSSGLCIFYGFFLFILLFSDTVRWGKKKVNKVKSINIKFMISLKLILNSLTYGIFLKDNTKYCLIQTIGAFI